MSPDLALALFKKCAGETEVIVASRYAETALYQVTGSHQINSPAIKLQFSLF